MKYLMILTIVLYSCGSDLSYDKKPAVLLDSLYKEPKGKKPSIQEESCCFGISDTSRSYLMKKIREKLLNSKKKMDSLKFSNYYSLFQENVELYLLYSIEDESNKYKLNFVEVFERKFPIMFTKVYGILTEFSCSKIKDTMLLYSDKDVCIKDCKGFHFRWSYNKGYIFRRKCDNLSELEKKSIVIFNDHFFVQSTWQSRNPPKIKDFN